MPYAIRRKYSYYARMRIPTDLAPILGHHYTVTLRTLAVAEARARAARLVADAASWWHALRVEAVATIRSIPISEITEDQLIKWFPRGRARGAAMLAAVSRLSPEEYELLRSRVRAAWERRVRQAVEAAEQQASAQEREIAELTAEGWRAGERAGLLAAVEAQARGAAAAGTPPAPAPATPAAPAGKTDPRRQKTLVELTEIFFADRDLSEKTQVSHRQVARDFHAVIGRKPIVEITAADVATYKTHLISQPGRAGRERAAPATVERALGHVRTVLKWATNEAGILSENPGERVRPPRASRSPEPLRLPFDDAALSTIFGSPLYTGCQRLGRWHEPGVVQAPADLRFFLLAMLLTGARTEELPGSGITDLEGIPCLDLRPTGTKSAAGARLVPIMDELRRTGFVDWARKRIADGGELFRGADCPADWSAWTGRYLDRLGVTDRQHVPYSLRHNFRLILRAANLNSDVANRIFGHEVEGAGRHYGRVPLEPAEAAAFVRAVRSPVDLAHLYVRGRGPRAGYGG